MAINYLNSIDLNQNELIHGTIENQPNDTAAGTPVSGQLYYNTSIKALKYGKDDGTGTIVWSVIDTDTGITSINATTDGGSLTTSNTLSGNGTLTLQWQGSSAQYVDGSGALQTFPTIPTVPSNIVETIITTNGTYIDLTPATATDGNVTITADLSATGTPNNTKYLRGDNTWAAISGIYAWDIAGDTGSETIVNGDTVTFAGGTNVTTTYNSANNTLTIDATDQYAGTVTSVTAGTGLVLESGSSSVNPTIGVDYSGTDNYILSAGAATDAAAADTINFNDAGDSEVKQTTFGDIPIDALTEVKTYIDNSVTGGLIYQGGYNATTNTPDLDTNPSSSIKKGWTYTVTADGLFFTEQVRVGDVLIAEVDAPTALADWTTVQNNVDLASLTQVGIGNVNAGSGISVSYSNGTATVTNTETNSDNSFAATISATGTITHNLGTRDVVIQLYDTVTYETVYADVDRISTTQATITFASTPTNSIRVLVQKIG